MRLSKIIAISGIASRRSAEELIINGIVKVNNQTITNVVTFVKEGDEIIVGQQNISQWLKQDFIANEMKLWLFHKPKGVITSRSDPEGRTTLFSLLPQNLQGLISVGRLDYNTEGLILLTNNGSLARYFELPKNAIKRVYRCKVFGPILPSRDFLRFFYFAYVLFVFVNTYNYRHSLIMSEVQKNLIFTLTNYKFYHES